MVVVAEPAVKDANGFAIFVLLEWMILFGCGRLWCTNDVPPDKKNDRIDGGREDDDPDEIPRVI